MIGSLGAAHSTAQSEGVDGASGFYRFLVFQDENCLPTSPGVCGGCGRQERRWAGAGAGPGSGLFGSARGSARFLRGEQRRSGESIPPPPKHPGASLTLPCPGEEPILYSPF